MTEAVTEPPKVTISEETLLYHVRKVEAGGNYEVVFKCEDENEARHWAVQAYFNEVTAKEPRTWTYQVVERKKIFTTEVTIEL